MTPDDIDFSDSNFVDDILKNCNILRTRAMKAEASLADAEALIKRNAELMNGYLARITELESQILHQTAISACRIEGRERLQKQITALKEIAVEERACRLSSPETGAIPTVEHYNAMDPEGSMSEACHQLEEEHPEAFGYIAAVREEAK